FGLVRLTVREALAFAALNGKYRTFSIGNVAGRIAEIELCQIAMQVLFGAMLIDALHAAFEDREITLNRVRMDLAAHVLARAVLHSLMIANASKARRIEAAFIGEQAAFLRHVLAHDPANRFLIGNG